jgi:UDP-N-acetylglucosamine 4-epimerase
MIPYETVVEKLKIEERAWFITGIARFFGRNLLEALLKINQRVICLGCFTTGFQYNFNEVKTLVSAEQWQKFRFIKVDIFAAP